MSKKNFSIPEPKHTNTYELITHPSELNNEEENYSSVYSSSNSENLKKELEECDNILKIHQIKTSLTSAIFPKVQLEKISQFAIEICNYINKV